MLEESKLTESDMFTDQRGWEDIINKHLYNFLVEIDPVIHNSKVDGCFYLFFSWSLLLS